ncbi:MAG: hypothetical protein ACREMS_02585 [Gemmatimonadaceae bacterium]
MTASTTQAQLGFIAPCFIVSNDSVGLDPDDIQARDNRDRTQHEDTLIAPIGHASHSSKVVVLEGSFA